MRNKDIVTLGDIYGKMFKQVKVVEEACGLCASDNISKSKKKTKMPENAFTKKNELQKGGPQEKGGFHKALNDSQDFNTDEDNEEEYASTKKSHKTIDKLKKKLKNGNISSNDRQNIQKKLKELEKNAQNEEAEERMVKESKKIARKRLNTFMTKKSTFDKLFESVMGGAFDAEQDAQEVDALGLGDAPTDDEFDMEDDMGGDEVTVTLSRDLAQQLHDVLMGVLGGEEDMGDEGEDLDFGDEGEDFGDEGEADEDAEEDDDMSYDEDEERGVFPTDKVGNDGTVGAKDSKGGGQQHKLQGKSNKVNGRPQPKGQKTKVVGTTDKVGNDGDYGHALHGAKQPDMGKQNKVSDIRQAEDFFR